MRVKSDVALPDTFYSLLSNDSATRSATLTGNPRKMALQFMGWVAKMEDALSGCTTPTSEWTTVSEYLRVVAENGLTVLYAAMQKLGRTCSIQAMLDVLSEADNLYKLESEVPPGKTRMQLNLFLDSFRVRSRSEQGLKLSVLRSVLLGSLAEVL